MVGLSIMDLITLLWMIACEYTQITGAGAGLSLTVLGDSARPFYLLGVRVASLQAVVGDLLLLQLVTRQQSSV